MKLNLHFDVDQEEVLRLLASAGAKDPAVLDLVRQAADCVRETAVPRAVWRQAACGQLQPLLSGEDIAAHLQGCPDVIVLACTLGREMDQRLQRLEIQNIALAAAADAAASVAVESLAETVEQQLRCQCRQRGLFLTGRFSPGYGDYPIQVQSRLLTFLDAPRRLGLLATETHLLTPRKSITALCGVSSRPVTGKRAGCEHCALRENCNKRKEGKTCG